jgi:hypothetical protein
MCMCHDRAGLVSASQGILAVFLPCCAEPTAAEPPVAAVAAEAVAGAGAGAAASGSSEEASTAPKPNVRQTAQHLCPLSTPVNALALAAAAVALTVSMHILCCCFFFYVTSQVGNGGNTEHYSWHQTLEEVSASALVPPHGPPNNPHRTQPCSHNLARQVPPSLTSPPATRAWGSQLASPPVHVLAAYATLPFPVPAPLPPSP